MVKQTGISDCCPARFTGVLWSLMSVCRHRRTVLAVTSVSCMHKAKTRKSYIPGAYLERTEPATSSKRSIGLHQATAYRDCITEQKFMLSCKKRFSIWVHTDSLPGLWDPEALPLYIDPTAWGTSKFRPSDTFSSRPLA